MSVDVHDHNCDTGQPCAMCVETGYCCAECEDTDRRELAPTFAADWQQAPRTVHRLVTESDAEYWWLLGQRAGRISEQVETRWWLLQMMEGYSERISK